MKEGAGKRRSEGTVSLELILGEPDQASLSVLDTAKPLPPLSQCVSGTGVLLVGHARQLVVVGRSLDPETVPERSEKVVSVCTYSLLTQGLRHGVSALSLLFLPEVAPGFRCRLVMWLDKHLM